MYRRRLIYRRVAASAPLSVVGSAADATFLDGGAAVGVTRYAREREVQPDGDP
jgi:hypothetical protein